MSPPISPPANRAPVGVADAYSTAEDTALVVAAPGVLGNDTDADGDSLFAFLFELPSHGNLVFQPDGSFTYTPGANFHGSDGFSYVPFDGIAFGDETAVSITVTPVNDRPVGAPESYDLAKKVNLVVAAPGVLGNDSDPDGDTLTAVLVTGPSHGSLTLNANGSFTYDPAANNPVDDSFTYRPSDGTTTGDPVTVTLVGTRNQPRR